VNLIILDFLNKAKGKLK